MLASLFWRLSAFFAGIVIGSFIPGICSNVWTVLFIILSILLRRLPRLRRATIVLVFFALGLWRVEGREIPGEQLATYFGETQVWSFWVCADPEQRWDGQSLVLCPAAPVFQGKALEERLAVKLPLYPSVYYGDYLELRCRLEKPAIFEDFDYAAYLSARGIGATCSWPSVISIKEGVEGGAVMRKLYAAKRAGLKVFNRALPEPESGLATALLLGYKYTLVPTDDDNFKKAGLSHIVAISGGHISLFLEIIIGLAVYLGVNKRKAIWPALAFAAMYVLLTGVQASAWRSLLMGGIMLYAWRRGRLQTAWLPLVLAGAYMLYQNPLLWRYDLGFQLSFLAVAGMIAFNPIMATRIYPYESSLKRFWQTLVSAFKLSLSAQIAVWPLLALTSGGVSLISPFTNVLAFWVFGPLVVVMLIALTLTGFLGVNLLVWSPVYLLLKYLLYVGTVGAHFPGGYIEVPWFTAWHAGIYYCALIIFVLIRAGKNQVIKKAPYR
ncbi:MAG: ComEC/Rec2 family competence protein [bacterium]|nr:ComEC/Rec2 family competence protein [bacterium]